MLVNTSREEEGDAGGANDEDIEVEYSRPVASTKGRRASAIVDVENLVTFIF